jgi:hypothetical protein
MIGSAQPSPFSKSTRGRGADPAYVPTVRGGEPHPSEPKSGPTVTIGRQTDEPETPAEEPAPDE